MNIFLVSQSQAPIAPTPLPVERVTLPADTTVSDTTAARMRDGVAAGTRRVYTGDRDRFHSWCREAGRTLLPATRETLAEYAAHLAECDRAPSTIERALAAIRTEHNAAGHAVPDTLGARAVIRSHRRRRAQAGHRTRKAAPLLDYTAGVDRHYQSWVRYDPERIIPC